MAAAKQAINPSPPASVCSLLNYITSIFPHTPSSQFPRPGWGPGWGLLRAVAGGGPYRGRFPLSSRHGGSIGEQGHRHGVTTHTLQAPRLGPVQIQGSSQEQNQAVGRDS